MGGVWVEIMKDTSLRVLPVDAGEVKNMFTELKAAPLLQGARGSLPVDLDALAAVVAKLSDVAVSLGDSLGALEVNPLWVNGSQIEVAGRPGHYRVRPAPELRNPPGAAQGVPRFPAWIFVFPGPVTGVPGGAARPGSRR